MVILNHDAMPYCIVSRGWMQVRVRLRLRLWTMVLILCWLLMVKMHVLHIQQRIFSLAIAIFENSVRMCIWRTQQCITVLTIRSPVWIIVWNRIITDPFKLFIPRRENVLQWSLLELWGELLRAWRRNGKRDEKERIFARIGCILSWNDYFVNIQLCDYNQAQTGIIRITIKP